jgi:hypothetical protein
MLNFNAITISGSLLSNEFIANTLNPKSKLDAFEASTFDPAWKSETDFEAALNRSWLDLVERYDNVMLSGSLDVSTTREKWVLPLLRQLGFEPQYQKAAVVVDKQTFQLSHFGWEDRKTAPPIHVIANKDMLDARDLTKRGSKSAQHLLQDFLNQSKDHEWGILTNGSALRVLRDYYHTAAPGYVQFNLAQMFETHDINTFRALFRLAHASRFRPREGGTWLDTYYQTSRAEGTRAEAALRGSVRAAVEVLGNGLLNDELRQRLEEPERLNLYYQELMRLIYRVIFMLYAEQRHLIPNLNAKYATLFQNEYSVTTLRDLADNPSPIRDTNTDLWERLVQTFRMMNEGCEPLGVDGFNSRLFDPDFTSLTVGNPNPGERLHRPDLPHLANSDLLKFVHHLAYSTHDGTRERINYRDLEVEEIGHVYEGLLDYAPRIASEIIALEEEKRVIEKGQFFLDPRGMSRKSSGSYYTPKDLVQEVLNRSLIPVIEARLEEAGEDSFKREDALLDIRVCDPACGSGAFLIGATNVLARYLVDIRLEQAVQTGGKTDADTPQRLLDEAKRDVLAHCIYGVDINPMAVELCKVALWINATERGKPLTFLDHRIKCGNSLVGAPLNFFELGIHPDAFKGRGDEDPETVKVVRKIATAKQIEQWRTTPALFDITLKIDDLSDVEDDTLERARRKAQTYQQQQEDDARKKLMLMADYWTAAFFYPVKGSAQQIPNQSGLAWFGNHSELSEEQLYNAGGTPILPQTRGQITALKNRYKFFHYWLEFPEIFFDDDGKVSQQAGFDVVLGNPPWEVVQPEESMFFPGRDDAIANATGDKRKKMIEKLSENNPILFQQWKQYVTDQHSYSNFVKVSERFPYMVSGKVNLYAAFAEHNRDIINPDGRVGMICPSGVATDDSTKELFQGFVTNKSLVTLFDFENREKIFSAVDSRMKFCILILAAPNSYDEPTHLSFFNTNIKHLFEGKRRFTLVPEEFALINPNTLTCPTFRSSEDAELTKKIYLKAGVFVNENNEDAGNPWGIKLMQMINMTSDSGLFETKEELLSRGYELVDNLFTDDGDFYLPLYEAKLAHQYNHRFATYTEGEETRDGTLADWQDPKWVSLPRYWINKTEVDSRLVQYDKDGKVIWQWAKDWLLGFRDIARSTDERTAIFSLLPRVGVGHTSPLVFLDVDDASVLCFLGNINSLILDYSARQKVGGTHLTYSYLKQFPILPPSVYANAPIGVRIWMELIVPKVFELTYTSWDIKSFADDLWREADKSLRDLLVKQWQANGGHEWTSTSFYALRSKVQTDHFPYAPFKWNEDRRAELRAELDAIYAHLYGLTREELLWILDPRDVDPGTPSVTFPGLRKKEMKEFGEYRTKRLVLKYFDEWAKRIPTSIPAPQQVEVVNAS